MPVTILHVGLPFEHPRIPPQERQKVMQRVAGLQQRMRDAGYGYNVVQVSPESGLDEFRDRLRAQPCDGVLIGGGIASDSEMSYFMEQIIDAVHRLTPDAKVMFHNHSEDVSETVGRWFPRQLA
jgi:hypothetical protein